MDTTPVSTTTSSPVPPPRLGPQPYRLIVHALKLVTIIPLLPLATVAIRLAGSHCLPSARGRRPIYQDGSILVIAILARLWQLSYQEVLDWLVAWPALAQACGLPKGVVPAKSTLSKRLARLGNAPLAVLFCLVVEPGLLLGQVVKHYERRRVVGVTHRLVRGTPSKQH